MDRVMTGFNFRKRAFGSMLAALGALAVLAASPALAQTEGESEPVIDVFANDEPVRLAIAPFLSSPELANRADDIRAIVESNLDRSGLFEIIPREAYISQITDFDLVPQYADWRTINAEALITGFVSQASDGRLIAQFRLFDTTAEEQLTGLQYLADPDDWRRVGHKISDGAYAELTGEGPYFDSRVVFVAESGPKGDRKKRLAVMDQDGANVRYLPDASGLVLSPRFSPNDQQILYISYNTGSPEVYLMNLDTNQRERLGSFPGMTFAPQFSPSGNEVIVSLAQDGNTDLYAINLASRRKRRLTRSPAIETSPSYSPDGSQIVFESDRSGKQQLYVMSAGGGEGRRISFGSGSYGTPVWSPKGDLIAFTKIQGGRFHIGVMAPDGSGERLLTSSFLDEGPTFAPNGRYLMFYRESAGAQGSAVVMSVDVNGTNLRRADTPGMASDPAWSPLRK
ncbi:MAG: Tol-Pal system beta propeller repeat protein TolB [Pseudomonadota bacterium]